MDLQRVMIPNSFQYFFVSSEAPSRDQDNDRNDSDSDRSGESGDREMDADDLCDYEDLHPSIHPTSSADLGP
jgi:hypothetical protein